MCWRQIGLADGGWAFWQYRQTARGLEKAPFLPQTVVFLYNGPAAWTWLISSHVHAGQYSHCVFLVVYIYIYTCVCVCLCPHREGIQWEAIDWMDNAECLDLIEKVTDSQSDHERAKSPPGSTANRQPECADPDATVCLHWPPSPTLSLYCLVLHVACTVMYTTLRLEVCLMKHRDKLVLFYLTVVTMMIKITNLVSLGEAKREYYTHVVLIYLHLAWWHDSCCMTVCIFRNMKQGVAQHRACSVNLLFINKRENWMNYYAVSWTHCYNKSCQMCPNGIITSSIMTAVCFNVSAPLVCLPFRNWACWLLSMRRVASPKARTTPFWRNCTAAMQWVHAHT